MRIPQGLKLDRAKNLYLLMVQSFYENLQHMYNKSEYQHSNILNVNELSAKTNREWC